MKFRGFVASVCVLALCACGGAGRTLQSTPDRMARFSYAMPQTNVHLSGTLTLVQCEDADSETRLLAVPNLAVVQSAAASPTTFIVDQRSLHSRWDKRELTLEMHENRTLSAINSTSSDQTATAIINVLRTIASVAGAVTAPGVPEGPEGFQPTRLVCNAATRQALAQKQALLDQLESARAAIANPATPLADFEGLQQKIDLLSLQLAHVVTNRLTVPVKARIPINESGSNTGRITWTLRELAPWFAQDPVLNPCAAHPRFTRPNADTPACNARTTAFAMTYRIDGSPEGDRPSQNACVNGGTGDDTRRCRSTIFVVEPAMRDLTVSADSPNLVGVPEGSTFARATLVLPQWGNTREIDLDVGFGRSRTLNAQLDQFGRMTSFTWNSEAQAANITGGIASIAEQGVLTYASFDDADPTATELMQQQTAELTAQLELNRLLACEVVIRSGGTQCPEN